jgi:hypothetical protein
MRKLFIVPIVTAALIGGATAGAAPAVAQSNAEIIPLTCDNGQTYDVAVNGNGEFTPGRIVDSTGVLIPVSFGESTFTATLPDGTVLSDTEPGSAKGGGNVGAHNPASTVNCTFSETFVNNGEIADLPVGTVLTFSGSVTVFITPRR